MSPEADLDDRTVAIKLGYGDWQDLAAEERVRVSARASGSIKSVPRSAGLLSFCCHAFARVWLGFEPALGTREPRA